MTPHEREVMQQTLDALEELNMTRSGLESLNHEIEALRAALAQPEHFSDCAVYNEPAYPKGECDCKPKTVINVNGVLEQAGYAKKKEWVGLTDEEAKKTFEKHNCTISAELAGILARAITAKLKEKNT